MGRLLRLTLGLFALLTTSLAYGQGGAIYGRIVDENGEPFFGANVQVSQGGILKGGAQTDFDGNYIVKPLDQGQYDVLITGGINYNKENITGVVVTGTGDTKIDKKLVKAAVGIKEVVVTTSRYVKPLLDDKQVLTGEDIKNLPTRSTADMVSLGPGTYQKKQGEGISFGGGRTDANVTIVDGVIRRGNGAINMAQGTIAQIEVFNSGLPAKYGDATGGVTSITTRGVSKNYQGGMFYERSVEGFGHNLLNLNLSGPFVSKAVNGIKKPKAGFLIGVDLINDKDNDPTYVPNYYLNADKLAAIQAHPLTQIQTSNGT